MILVIGIFGFGSSVYASTNYDSYCNARFGFSTLYPTAFGMAPSSDNNDGRKFYDRDGFSMTVSASYNALDYSLRDEMRSMQQDFDKVTYRRLKGNWFVLSGYSGSDILYIKTYLANGTLYHLYMKYPYSMKRVYDSIVSNVSKSFVPYCPRR